MDIQLKRGLPDVCVPAAIKDDESYGYRIIKDMKPYVDIFESTLYPLLRRLEVAELLTVRTAEHNGRLRKYYHITPPGHRPDRRPYFGGRRAGAACRRRIHHKQSQRRRPYVHLTYQHTYTRRAF